MEDNILIPVPSFHVELAALDALHPVHYSRRLLIFRCTSLAQRDAQLAALKVGLQALGLRCPILGGTITPLQPAEINTTNSNPDWRTIRPDPGIELVVKDLRAVLPSFEELKSSGFPITGLPYNLLVPVPQDIGNDRPSAACKIQFSTIEGGTILTWAMSHCVADGSGNNELMHVLSEATKLAQDRATDDVLAQAAASTQIGFDRSIMRGICSEIPFRIEDHPGYMANAPKRPPSHPFEATSAEVSVLFHIPATRVAQLKADATQPGAPPISTHDAICALIWRSLILIRSHRSPEARNVPDSAKTNLFMPSDARRHLNLPQSYIGNAVYQLSVSIDLGTILAPSSGLREAASAVRRAITAVNPTLVRSVMAETNKRWVDWAFLGSYSSTGVAMGTDWTSSALYQQDWGTEFGGAPARYRYPNEPGVNCIMPKLPDGAAEVIVSVMEGEAARLSSEECFGKYIEPQPVGK
ncbi:uncharacterized protein PV07_02118 [Cladophialophora immunda]|uniref:Trichothecene 3-O-acetyltransferase n=1 Tax=Cladophialophora immunda TaxID=569365 RepID=A0A0D2A4Z6_9EURO|nr:uncharacterized protein PV07_02118 [Cladophialophora immunda]KIW35421.1 hypothetical protein PV07_02118 [Cladophialophora immunda]OQV02802.1 hypothetical protein CLAIMM_07937 isoform 1 [Cladophialophora immunda]OQV02803.1 hypothetical protein CLAIMM_07937 isoform 2 [Cladophialophora immunda]